MKHEPFWSLDDVRNAFTHPLPGAKAHYKVATESRIRELLSPLPPITKAASVLLLLYSVDGCLHFPLIQRASNPRDRHGGQVSLPGGSQKANELIQDTAFREAEEEVGVKSDKIIFIGQLSPIYVPPSNFLVSPCVAAINQRPHFCINADEVDELFEVPLSSLMNSASLRFGELELQDRKVKVPHFQLGSVNVVGATAMILSEFQMLLDATNRLLSTAVSAETA